MKPSLRRSRGLRPRRTRARRPGRAAAVGLGVAAAILPCGCGSGEGSSDAGDRELAGIEWVRGIGADATATDSALLQPIDLTADGDRILVLDAGAPGVRVLDRVGALVATLGSQGGGPGEFRQVAGLAVAPDGTIAVADRRAGRITMFDARGEIAAEFRVEGRLGSLRFDRAGRLHIDQKGPIDGRADPGAPTVRVAGRDGATVLAYGRYEPQDHPLADAMNNEGRLALAADGGMWVLYTYRGVVHRYSPEGELEREIVLPPPRGRPAGGPFVQESPGRPDAVLIVRMPAADDLAIDARGRLLILVLQLEPGAGSYSELLAFTTTGEPIGRERLRARARRMAVRGDTIYALRDASADLPVIDVYTLDGGAE